MPYLVTTWKDRAVDTPMTYTLQDNGNGTTTLVPAEGNISEVGTPLTAANLNHMEEGIHYALRTDETGNMNSNWIQQVKIKLPASIFGSVGGGLDANNSDLVNLNSLWWADAATGDGESILWPRTAAPVTPAGSLVAADYDGLRVLNGTLYLKSIPIGSVEGNILWTGASYMTAAQTVTPSKSLSNCANGWVLVWSDFDNPSTSNDWDFQYTLIPKRTDKLGFSHQFLLANYATATQVVISCKTLTFSNTVITGNAINNSADVGNNNQDAVLRMVLEI